MKKVKVIIALGVAIAALALLAGCGKAQIDLNKYLTVTVSGYDGYGTASVELDWDAIEEKYGSKLKYGNLAMKEYGGLLNYMTPMDVLEDCVNVTLSESRGLENGDKLQYKFKVDEDYSGYVNCSLKYVDGDQVVKSLDPIKSFDAFADVSVTFSGVAPQGSATVEYTGDRLSKYDVTADKVSSLKNGDTITVTISDNVVEKCIQNYGEAPAELSKTYTVSGLSYYLSCASELTSEIMNKAKEDAKDVILAYAAKSYDKTSVLGELKYEGYIFESIDLSKNVYFIPSYNDLILVFSGMLSSTANNFVDSKVYFPVKIENMLMDSEITYSVQSSIHGSFILPGGYYYSNGYKNPYECYESMALVNKDSYIIEFGDGFEQYTTCTNIDKLSDVTEELRSALYEDAKSIIMSKFNYWLPQTAYLSDLGYLGAYMLNVKDSASNLYDVDNDYIMVCAATLNDSSNLFESITLYFAVEFSDIEKVANEYYVSSMTTNLKGTTSIPNTWYSSCGYANATDLFNDFVTSNRDRYKYEMTEELKQFGE